VRSGYRSPIGTVAKTGCGIASGSHQPLTSAAVSEVNAALAGSTSCQPRNKSLNGLARGT
jgi:hypothetical protein